MPPEPTPPVLGRASPASSRPAVLRVDADASTAAYRADGGDGDGWSVRAATVAGVRHRLAGNGPEDAFAWRLVPLAPVLPDDDVDAPVAAVLAVADGVGSVPGSAAAASAAVLAACTSVTASLAGGARRPGADPDGEVWRDAFGAAAEAVRHAGGATTLIVAVVWPVPDDASAGRRDGAVARIGDSTAFARDDGGWAELWVADAADDAPVSTGTAALSGRPDQPRPEAVAVTLGDGDALVLVSDGVANPWRDGPTTVAPALATALHEPPGPLALALLADFSRQGCFDDRTILGLWPGAGEAAGGASPATGSAPGPLPDGDD